MFVSPEVQTNVMNDYRKHDLTSVEPFAIYGGNTISIAKPVAVFCGHKQFDSGVHHWAVDINRPGGWDSTGLVIGVSVKKDRMHGWNGNDKYSVIPGILREEKLPVRGCWHEGWQSRRRRSVALLTALKDRLHVILNLDASPPYLEVMKGQSESKEAPPWTHRLSIGDVTAPDCYVPFFFSNRPIALTVHFLNEMSTAKLDSTHGQ